jgi:diguanylate cyclase (GGDEF)-like protein/PAS domain S-box-containing protein
VVLAAALLAAGSLHTPARGGPLGPKRVALLALLPVLPPLALLAPQPPPAAVAVLGTVLASALVAMRLREAGHLAVEVERRHGADRQATLSSAAGTVVLILDDAGRVAESSGSLWGRTPEEVLGHTPDALVAPDDAGRVRALVADAITGRNGGALPTRVRGGDGQWRHVEVVATDLRAAPEVGGLTLILRTLATTGELDRQLVHHAFQDPLTGLPNRELFGDRVAHALARQQRGDGKAAILAVDLDDFRAVNAALGTAAGDALLIAVAERVESCLRDGDTAARLGGDAFAVLLENLPDAEHANAVAARVLEVLQLPLEVGGEAVAVAASIGIALAGPDTTAQMLLQHARHALAQAKVRGKARAEVFTPAGSEQALSHLELKADLARAIARDELFLLYQPLVDLRTGRTMGAEALLRWRHPDLGVLGPSTFLPLAEEAGLAVTMGRRILLEACQAARRWRLGSAEAAAVTVHVDVSAMHVRDPGFVADVRRALERASLDGAALVVELAEGTIMAEERIVLDVASRLRRLGVRLAVDHFGTGSGTPGYLRNLRVDLLKVDRAFVGELGRGAGRPTAIRGILATARTLGVQTAAEGVEHEAQREDLLGLGCPCGQGALFGEPVDAQRIGALLADSA